MPEGPWHADIPEIFLPDKKDVYSNMEAMIYHFKIIMHGVNVPPGESYVATEAANGELGFYVVSDGEMKPYKCRCRAPCFHIFSAFPSLAEDGMIADAIAILGSLNIIAGELDR